MNKCTRKLPAIKPGTCFVFELVGSVESAVVDWLEKNGLVIKQSLKFEALNLNVMIFKNAISWFEIPANDIDRAQKFYQIIFDIQMVAMDIPHKMRIFPTDNPMNISGAICYNADFYKPSSEGTLVYLNGNPDVQNILNKVEAAGGKIIVPKTEISLEYGHIAVFMDSEGNRIGLHSVSPAN